MSNLFWFVLVSAIGLAASIISIYVNRKTQKLSTFIAFYLFAAGLSWIGEFSVLGLFNSYAYYPDIFKDQWAQNLFGHLLLNTTLYPAAAVIMAAFSLKYGWTLFVTALFSFLEFFFVRMGLYEQHWWAYYMTVITSVSYITFAGYCFKRITKKPSKAFRAFILYFAAMVVVHIPAPVLLLLGLQRYELGFLKVYYGNDYLVSILIVFTYHLVECFLLILFTCILKKPFWKAMPFIVSIAAQSIFRTTGILVPENGWKLFYTFVVYAAAIALFELLERFAFLPDKEEGNKEPLCG